MRTEGLPKAIEHKLQSGCSCGAKVICFECVYDADDTHRFYTMCTNGHEETTIIKKDEMSLNAN